MSSLYEKYRPFFEPRSVIILGVSRNEYTFNGVLLKNLLEAQYKGNIWIVHPYAKEIMGMPCFPSIEALQTNFSKKGFPDLAIILTLHNMLENIERLAEKGTKHFVIETDLSVIKNQEQKKGLMDGLNKIAKEKELFIAGPAMIGIIDFIHNFTTSIIPARSHILLPNQKPKPEKGISFLAQSGGLTGACGWWKPTQPVPFSKVIHVGKGISVKEGDMLEYLFEDPTTAVIILYIKSIPDCFIEVMKRNPYKKPLIFKYVGKSKTNLKEFKELGALEVPNYIELFEMAKVFLWCPLPKSYGVGIIGPSSGAINLLLNAISDTPLYLAPLEPGNRDFILEQIGGSTCELGNPVDYWPPAEFIGTQICKIYHQASKTLLKDQHVGILALALEFFIEIEFDFEIFEGIKEKYPDKPIICVLIQAEKEGADRVFEIANRLKIPVFNNEPERAIRALELLVQYHKAKEKNQK